MTWQYTQYAVPLAVATLAAAAFGGYAIVRARRRDWDPLLVSFAVVMGLVGAWTLTYLVQLSVTNLETKLLLRRISIYPDLAVPAWIAFVGLYTDTDWLLDRRVLGLLLVEPLAVTVLLPFDPLLGLFFVGQASTMVPAWPGGPVVLQEAHGVLFAPTVAYVYLAFLFGLVVFLKPILRSKWLYRGQTLLTLSAVLVPLAANAVQQFLDPLVAFTPLAFTGSGALLGVAVFRYELLDVVPVARDTVVESMRDGYLVLDDRDRVVDLNPAAQDLLDLSERVVGRPAADVLPDPTVLSAADEEPSGRATGELVLEGSGSPRYVELDASPLSEGVRFDGRLVILRDVTDRRSVEQRYQALIERSSDVVSVLAPDGTYQYQSPSAERVLGYDPGAMVGENAFEYVHPDDRDRVNAAFAEHVDEPGATVRVEYRFRHADGDYRAVESLGRNLLEDPNVSGIVVNTRDVTERVERERELAEKNERLEEFASVVSHDLRNPLSVAQGYVGPAMDDPDRFLPEIETSLDRMEAIIEDVLALARQDDAVTDPETLSLATVARRAWNQVDTGAATLSVDGDLDFEADPDRTQQLLENLFRNSVEHGGDGVVVRVGATDDGFYVEDDGPGIPEGERDSVFESGYTTADEGTGFGLAIVERIAEAHGWTVTATESHAGGARFEVATRAADRRVAVE